MSRILVTGAGGYIGRHVADYLTQRSHSVTGTWHRSRGSASKKVEMVQIDLADAAAVEKLMGGGAFEAVIHAAAIIDGANTVDNLRNTFAYNVQAHTNLVSAALKAACRRFLFCSSISVYGGAGAGPAGYREDDTHPNNIYGWSKLAGEQVLGLAAGLDRNFVAVSLRLAGVHGRGRKDGALHALSSAAQVNRPLAVKDPESRFRWLFIEDMLSAFDTLLKAPLPAGHHVCNLASADSFTLLEVAKSIKMLCGSSSPIETSGSAVRNEVMNIDRSIALWGFAPTGLSELLPAYLSDFAARA